LKRLFLDANVLFSAAHNPKGKAALVIELGAKGHWEVLTSAYAAEEARRNIAIKFPDCLSAFDILLKGIKIIPSGTGRLCPVPLPEKDRPILEAAIRHKATHLLTGDIRDFGSCMNKPEITSGVIVRTVADFLRGI